MPQATRLRTLARWIIRIIPTALTFRFFKQQSYQTFGIKKPLLERPLLKQLIRFKRNRSLALSELTSTSTKYIKQTAPVKRSCLCEERKNHIKTKL